MGAPPPSIIFWRDRIARQRSGSRLPETARRRELLRGLPGFGHLPQEALADLAEEVPERHHPQRAVIVREGETGTELWVVAEGRLEASQAGSSGPTPLALLGPGEFFGELALLAPHRTRQATVTALTDVVLLELDDALLARVFAAHPEIEGDLRRHADEFEIARFLKQVAAFDPLDQEERRSLARHVEITTVPGGTDIVTQGQAGDRCFVLRAGRAIVLVTDEDGERAVATPGPGVLFGETALLTGSPRNATVRAEKDCEVLSLRREPFLDVALADPDTRRRVIDLLRLREYPVRAKGVEEHPRPTPEGESITILKNPRTGQYFRLSSLGFFVWERLDGRHNVKDLALEYLERFRAFAPQPIAETVAGLAGAGFAVTKDLSPELLRGIDRSSLWRRFSLASKRLLTFMVDIRGVHGRLSRIYDRGVHILYTSVGRIVLAGLAVAGLVAFVSIWDQATGVLAESRPELLWFLVPGAIVALLVHEAGHAFTTIAFGREVLRAGIGWFWFGPIAFVDISDMWLANRRQRLAVALAGPYAEIVLAGTLSLVALLVGNPVIVTILWGLALASYISVLRNLNPLLEFDGYYALIHLLNRPNLRRKSLAWLGNELPGALREPRRLRGHLLEVVYGLSSVAYLIGAAVLIVIIFRATLQGWVDRFLPHAAAEALAWALGAGFVFLTVAAVTGEIRREEGRRR